MTARICVQIGDGMLQLTVSGKLALRLNKASTCSEIAQVFADLSEAERLVDIIAGWEMREAMVDSEKAGPVFDAIIACDKVGLTIDQVEAMKTTCVVPLTPIPAHAEATMGRGRRDMMVGRHLRHQT